MTNTEKSLKTRWYNMMVRLGVEIPDDKEFKTENMFNRAMSPYKSSGRYYHNLDHLQDGFQALDRVWWLMERPELVSLAYFYHDVIQGFEDDCEALSRDFMTDSISGIIGDSSIAVARNMIMCTKHDPKHRVEGDARYICDIDLVGLAAGISKFARNNENIRKEYPMFNDLTYARGRKEVLLSFLNRDNIFHTKFFRMKYEERAVSNLSDAIRRLSLEIEQHEMDHQRWAAA